MPVEPGRMHRLLLHRLLQPGWLPQLTRGLCQPPLTFPGMAAGRRDPFLPEGGRRDVIPPRLTKTGISHLLPHFYFDITGGIVLAIQAHSSFRSL